MNIEGKKIGYALCGSFCTFEKSFEMAKTLVEHGADLTPIMSFNASKLNTRFGSAESNVRKIETICGKKAIMTIEDAEPIGPKSMFDIIVVAPCTGNTIGKLAYGIIDTPVTMAVKSHIRNSRPVVIAVSTNDALSGCFKNIGMLANYRNLFFVPMRQDDYEKKPTSIVAKYDLLQETIEKALDLKQIQPMIIE